MGFAIAGALALGIGLGFVLASATYARELARMAGFLRGRDPGSNARMTVDALGPGLRELAGAVNDELDRATGERVWALTAQQEFQRDLSALSHDIRTPLTGAKGYLQLAREEAAPGRRGDDLAAAQDRIDATTALLDQLFAFTRAGDPDLALELAPVAVRPLVERVLLAHHPAFERLGWEPALRFEDDRFTIDADEAQLGRVFENLVVNAVRHGSGAPVIEQRAGRVTVSNRVEHPELIDAGRLFERFYQADAARGGGGTGLGLATAARLARAMALELTATLDGDVLTIALTSQGGRG